jgi:glycosyltransferase involved in cell wall biosynthesis
VTSAGEPLVTVLMAARNHEPFAADAASSVLTQDFERLELIAVDDASDDATPEILAQCAAEAPPGRMRVIRHDRQRGIAETRAHALSLARGEFIGLLDSDDLWLPGKVGPQAERLTEEPGVGLVHAEFEAFESETGEPLSWGARDWSPDADPLLELVRLGCFVMTGTTLIRRSAIEQRGLGFVNPGYPSYDDYLLFLTIALDWAFAHEPRVVMRYRRHEGNLTNVLFADNLARARASVLEQFVERFPEAKGRLGSVLRRTLALQLVTAAANERRGSKVRAARWTVAAVRQHPTAALGAVARIGGNKVARALAAK